MFRKITKTINDRKYTQEKFLDAIKAADNSFIQRYIDYHQSNPDAINVTNASGKTTLMLAAGGTLTLLRSQPDATTQQGRDDLNAVNTVLAPYDSYLLFNFNNPTSFMPSEISDAQAGAAQEFMLAVFAEQAKELLRQGGGRVKKKMDPRLRGDDVVREDADVVREDTDVVREDTDVVREDTIAVRGVSAKPSPSNAGLFAHSEDEIMQRLRALPSAPTINPANEASKPSAAQCRS